jgi:hypothetical protein
VPRRRGRLGAVVGILVRHALSDACRALFLDGHKQKRAVGNPAQTRFEKANERQAQRSELDPLDPHRNMLSQEGGLYCGGTRQPRLCQL